MMVDLNSILLIGLYFSLIILVIIFAVLGIKLIKTLNKVNTVVDNVNDKIEKVNGVFSIIDKTTDFASTVSDKIVNAITNFINKKIKNKKGNDFDE